MLSPHGVYDGVNFTVMLGVFSSCSPLLSARRSLQKMKTGTTVHEPIPVCPPHPPLFATAASTVSAANADDVHCCVRVCVHMCVCICTYIHIIRNIRNTSRSKFQQQGRQRWE